MEVYMGSIILRESAEFSSTSDSLDRVQKEKDYMDYLDKHINGVKTVYKRLFVPMIDNKVDCDDALFTYEELRNAIIQVKDAVEHHDESKYGELEFNAYRAHWNPTDEEKTRDQDYQNEVDLKYQEAWVNHYTLNDHHPKHWYDFENNVARDMSLGSIIHMLCDWMSFNLDSPSSVLKWWINCSEEERKFISPKTITILEYILYNILFPEEYKKMGKTSDAISVNDTNK